MDSKLKLAAFMLLCIFPGSTQPQILSPIIQSKAGIAVPAPIAQWKICGDTASSSACTPSASTSVRDSISGVTATWLGTQSGGTNWYTAMTPRTLQAYVGAFNGSDDSVNTSATVSVIGDISAGAWVNGSTFSGTGFIIEKADANAEWALFAESGNIKWRGAGADNGTVCAAPSTSAWHLLIGTQTGTTTALYIDGSQCTTGTSTAIANDAHVINIGALQAGGSKGAYFSGLIANARIWNVVLTPAQVAALYAQENH